VLPAERVQETDVQQLLRCAVGFGGVEDEGAVEVEDAGYGLSQLADGDVLAGADVDQRRRVFVEQRAEAGVVEVHQETAGLGEVVGVEELSARGSGSPDDHLLRARGLGLRRLADQRGQNVRAGEVEVVARAVEVGGHDGEVAGAVLAVVAPAHLDAGDLGNGIGPVGGFERPCEQVLLLDRLGTEPGVDAGGAEEEQALDTGVAAGLDDVGLENEVVADEVCGIGAVGEDATDPGRGEEDEVGPFGGEERIDGELVEQVKFLMRAGEDVAVSLAQEFAVDGGADQAAMAGDVDAAVGMHEGSMRGVCLSRCIWHGLCLVDVVCVEAVAQHEGVAFGGFEVGLDHLADELVEAGARSPAEFALCLACVAEQGFDLGGAEVARVYRDDDFAGLVDGFFFDAGALPGEVEVEQFGTALNKLTHAVLLAGRDDVVLRLLLLQHEPLHLDVIAGVAPVAFGVEVAEEELSL
jgi:hypothetical protein